jgi:hypothetical protein
MMKLWERNDAPQVDGAPGAGAHPYLVLCHRPPEEADDAAGDEPFALDDDDCHTAVVYQWVRIPG